MELGLQLNIGLRQEQKLNLQMRQSLEVLQVTTLQLEQMIRQELEVNPILEMEEHADQDLEQAEVRGDELKDDRDGNEPEEGILAKDHSEVNWEEYFKDEMMNGSGPRMTDFSRPDPDEAFERMPTYGRTLHDSLRDQLSERRTSPAVFKVVEYLIDCVGDDGMLRPPPSPDEGQPLPPPSDPDEAEAEAVLFGRKPLEQASKVVREAFHILRNFEPAGVGARDLRECLLLQARRRDNFPAKAIEILEKHFDMLQNLRFPALAKAMGIETQEVQRLIGEIGKLDPKPGRLVGEDISPAVIPDLMLVTDDRGNIEVRFNDGSVPRLRVSRTYKQMLENKNVRGDERRFLREKLNSANWFVKCIDQRKETILKVMNTIVELQRDFFLKGPNYLKPMILQDVADRIGMHISTVNRVTNGKYVLTSSGVVELKTFFSASVTQDDGSEVSSVQAREALKRLVAAEDPGKPLSDQQIVDLLDKEGLQVARRTVSKYREQLNILPARMRKKF